MITVEMLIVALWVAALASVVGGALGVMHEWAKVAAPQPVTPPPHRGGHRRPRLAVWLDGWRELAAAQALLRGDAVPTATVLIGGPL